jgi:hypothetical protein
MQGAAAATECFRYGVAAVQDLHTNATITLAKSGADLPDGAFRSILKGNP